jgi:hypothetical protein
MTRDDITDSKEGPNPSQRISNQIAAHPGWQGNLMSRLRKLIHAAAPEASEEWKWDSPVWTQKGLVLSMSPFKSHLKLNFFKGASLDDPQGLFNAGLEGKTMHSIDFQESDGIPEAALTDLIRRAVAFNLSGGNKK